MISMQQIDISSYLLRSDLEKPAIEAKISSYKAELKRQGFDNVTIFEKLRDFRKENSPYILERLSFSSKEEVWDYVRQAFGGVSRKVAVKLFEEKCAYVEIISEKHIIEDPYCPWEKPTVCKTWRFNITNPSYYSRMNNLPACLYKDIESFKFTQNLADGELRLGRNERTLLIYLENFRRQIFWVWKAEKEKDPSIKWKPYLYPSHKTIAYDLGWTVDQVRYSLKKLSFYFGEDFFRAPSKEEKNTRKNKRSWNFQTNLPPMRKWNAIIKKKIVLYIRKVGRPALRKAFTDAEYKEITKGQRKTKRNACYKENFMNDANREFERLTALGKYLKSQRWVKSDFLERKKEDLIKFFRDLIFGKPKIKKKFVPFPKASEYWKKKRAADKEKSDARKEESRKKWAFYGIESCEKSPIGLSCAVKYGNYQRNILKKSKALEVA